MVIQYEKTFQNAHKFYALVDNEVITMQYFFCSKSYALKHFKQLIGE
jgi:hypothetical protein